MNDERNGAASPASYTTHARRVYLHGNHELFHTLGDGRVYIYSLVDAADLPSLTAALIDYTCRVHPELIDDLAFHLHLAARRDDEDEKHATLPEN